MNFHPTNRQLITLYLSVYTIFAGVIVVALLIPIP